MSSCRVYIGHLNERTREDDVEEFFHRYGRIREILIKNGFGFVEFDSPRDAEVAVDRCNGKELRGNRVIVEMTRRPPRGRDVYRSMGNRPFGGSSFGSSYRGGGSYDPRSNPAYQYFPFSSQTKYKLIVKNLSTRYSWQDLKDMFRSVSEVIYADAHRERRNEGIVCFGSYADLKKAKDSLDGKECNGRKIELVEAYSRSRSRSRHRSTSRSRSRSRSSRSRTRSRSRSSKRSPTRSASRSRSRSPVRKSASRDRAVNGDNHSPSRSRSRSASPAENNDSRSKSGSPVERETNGD